MMVAACGRRSDAELIALLVAAIAGVALAMLLDRRAAGSLLAGEALLPRHRHDSECTAAALLSPGFRGHVRRSCRFSELSLFARGLLWRRLAGPYPMSKQSLLVIRLLFSSML